MGAPVFAPGAAPHAPARAARLLWTGMALYLERNGLGFAIGREVLSGPTLPPVAALPTASAAKAVPARPVAPCLSDPAAPWKVLMAEHGLHPDLETEARSGYRAWEAGRGLARRGAAACGDEPLRFWPAGLQEALLRGCRLACEPAYDPVTASLEFVWVASRDMLDAHG
jgi:hypothetical protein